VKSAADHRRRAAEGFTLIELLVVLALLGLMMGVTIRGVRSLASSDLRASASKLSGAIRYLFDRASITGKIHRLVIDFDQGRYWAEVTDDRIYQARERETEHTREEEAATAAREEEEARQREEQGVGTGEPPPIDITRYQPQEFRAKRAHFSSFKEMAIKPVQVPGGVKLAGLFTPRLADAMSSGHGYIYFYPMGLTEAALVYLSDERQETFYTLVVHPLTGRVGINNRYIQAPVEAQYDDAGNRIER
jgi:prepilin-type N-terminal cleavage/methylation domain-containing protein